MKVFLVLFLMFTSFSSQARKPAVEDFVGVMPENYKQTTESTKVLYDFNQDLEAKIKSNDALDFNAKTELSGFGAMGLALFVTLPFLMWFGITRTTRGDRPQDNTNHHTQTAQQEFNFDSKMASKENVAKLDDYRKKDLSETGKKAS